MYAERLSIVHLRAHVRATWAMRDTHPGSSALVLPDGSSDLILHQPHTGAATLQVVGVMTAPLSVPRLPGRHVALRLHPQAAGRLLGDAALFRDRSVPAEDVWGRAATDLLCAVQALPDTAVLAALQGFVHARVGPPEPRVAAAVSALEQAPVAIDLLAARLNLSVRQFSRLFAREVGLGPRAFSRVAQVRHVLPLLRGAQAPLTEVALRGGYADQAHLTREVRALTGLTPGAWRAGMAETCKTAGGPAR